MSENDGAAPKKYGLVIPKKQPKFSLGLVPKPNVFASNALSSQDKSDDDDKDAKAEEEKFKAAKRAPQSASWLQNKYRIQAEKQIDKALSEDPTAFQYDEVYEDIQESKCSVGLQEKREDKAARKPKYISSMLASTKRRKLEYELHLERKLQKEREKEGEEFVDKDKFVTSSYKAKLEELAAARAQLEQETRDEERNDATKVSDMSSFYRNLLNSKTTPLSEPSKHPEQSVREEEKGEVESVTDKHESSSEAETKSLSPEKSPIIRSASPSAIPENPPSPKPLPPKQKPTETEQASKLAVPQKRNDPNAISEAKRRYLVRKGLTGGHAPTQLIGKTTNSVQKDSDSD